jgi:sortase A
MRPIAFTLIAAGGVFTLAGVAFGVVSWTGQKSAQSLWDQEAPGYRNLDVPMRLSFPAQNKSFIVKNGASELNLLLGPARVEWSGIPGDEGNTVIAGHRDTHFRMLKDVRRNEVIAVERDGQTFRYRIVDLEIVSAANNKFYQDTGRGVLTLVTCYPFYYLGPAPKRYIVRAELLDRNS